MVNESVLALSEALWHVKGSSVPLTLLSPAPAGAWGKVRPDTCRRRQEGRRHGECTVIHVRQSSRTAW